MQPIDVFRSVPCRSATGLLVATIKAAALALAVGLHGLAAAASGAAGQKAQADAGPALRAEVDRLVGRAACDTDAQCRTLPLGTRACGGPEVYLAWSVLGTDAAALRRAAERYTQWQGRQLERSGAMSICMVEVDPGAVCAKPATTGQHGRGKCVTGNGAAGGATR